MPRSARGSPRPWATSRLQRRVIAGTLVDALRYGENPHQWGAFYRTGDTRFGVATATQVQGKELSYNNLNDADAAYELVAEFDPNVTAAVAIIKHANPCGVAIAATLKQAYIKALRCDPESAFGGVIALNRSLDADAARAIVEIFTEVIIAPDASDEAKAHHRRQEEFAPSACRRSAGPAAQPGSPSARSPADFSCRRATTAWREADLKIVTKRTPTAARNGRHDLRLHRGEARQVERHRLCQGGRHRRHRRRPDEPRRLGAHGGMERRAGDATPLG